MIEQMFGTPHGTLDHTLERAREDCRRELVANAERRARLDQRDMQLLRAADARGDWKAAGCSSRAQWLSQLSCIEYRTAKRITGVPPLEWTGWG